MAFKNHGKKHLKELKELYSEIPEGQMKDKLELLIKTHELENQIQKEQN